MWLLIKGNKIYKLQRKSLQKGKKTKQIILSEHECKDFFQQNPHEPMTSPGVAPSGV